MVQDLESPLHKACQKGHLAVAKELLARGADIDRQNVVSYMYLYIYTFVYVCTYSLKL